MNTISLEAKSNTATKILILAFMTSMYFVAFFHRVAVPGTIFNELQLHFNTSASKIALLGTLYLAPYATMQIFVGILVDKLGASRVLLLGSAVMVIGSIVFPLATSIGLLFASRFMIGLGASLIFLSVLKEMDHLFGPEIFAILLGIMLFFGFSGGWVATLPMERLSQAFGWQKTLLTLAIISGFVWLGMAVLLKRNQHLAGKSSDFSLNTLRQIITNKNAIPVYITASISFTIYFLAQATIGKKLLQDCAGFSSESAAKVTATMMFVVMCLTLLSGFMSKLIGNRRKPLVIGSTTLTLLGSIIAWKTLSHNDDINAWWMIAAFIMLCTGAACSPIFCCVAKELNTQKAAGTSVGLVNGAVYMILAISIYGAGKIMDRFNDQVITTAQGKIYPAQAYQAIFYACIAVAALAWIASFFIKETYGKYPDTVPETSN